MRLCYNGRPRHFDVEEPWAPAPCLIAVAFGPLRRALKIDAWPGGAITRLSALLRKIYLKFTPRHSVRSPSNVPEEPGYFSQRSGRMRGGDPKSEDELAMADKSDWGDGRI